MALCRGNSFIIIVSTISIARCQYIAVTRSCAIQMSILIFEKCLIMKKRILDMNNEKCSCATVLVICKAWFLCSFLYCILQGLFSHVDDCLSENVTFRVDIRWKLWLTSQMLSIMAINVHLFDQWVFNIEKNYIIHKIPMYEKSTVNISRRW